MMDLIDRQALLDKVKRSLISGQGDTRRLLDWIHNMPTIETEPVIHGRWKRIGHNRYSCSKCEQYVIALDIGAHKYCSYCGAKMDGKENE